MTTQTDPENKCQELPGDLGGVARRLPKYAPAGPSRILQTRPPMRDFTPRAADAAGPRVGVRGRARGGAAASSHWHARTLHFFSAALHKNFPRASLLCLFN